MVKISVAAVGRSCLLGSSLLLMGVGQGAANDRNQPSNGPRNPGTPVAHQLGDARAGREVYRFETFGNEGFWTDAVRLPAGVVAAGVTPLQALQLGLHVDSTALDTATRQALAAELKSDPTGQSSALLNDPATTLKLLNANAVIGLPAKDSDGDGGIDVLGGDKVGASCALCHSITDGAVLQLPGGGGSIGRPLDGRATHSLDFGTLLAAGTNSRAYYPVLQLSLDANGGKTLGRAPIGLTENSTEAEVDAYLTNKEFYPVGMFDDTVDGNGDPMHNMPLFRQDLAFPYGSEGSISRQDNFANLVYTALLDPTNITTPGGLAFVTTLGGAAGKEIVEDYRKVLKDTGVIGYPYVVADPPSSSALAGTEDFPLGVRVDNGKLIDLNAYLFALEAPRGVVTDAHAVANGRRLFSTVGCTGCHNVDQSRFVPTFIVPMKRIFPGDNPIVLAQRDPPLNPILDTQGNIFDDKMAVVNASIRGLKRGTSLPLLLDLARKPVFLHDNSVGSLKELLHPRRGRQAPHPFFLYDPNRRADMVAFLKSLDTE